MRDSAAYFFDLGTENETFPESKYLSGNSLFWLPDFSDTPAPFQLLGGNQSSSFPGPPPPVCEMGTLNSGEACIGAGVGVGIQCWAGFGGLAGLSSMVSAVKNCLSILFHCLLLVWPWASYFIFWAWFLLCEMRRQVVPAPYGLMWKLHKGCTWNHTQYLVILTMEKNLHLKLVQYCKSTAVKKKRTAWKDVYKLHILNPYGPSKWKMCPWLLLLSHFSRVWFCVAP